MKTVKFLSLFFASLTVTFSQDWMVYKHFEKMFFFDFDCFDSENYVFSAQKNDFNNGNYIYYNYIGFSNDSGNTWNVIYKLNSVNFQNPKKITEICIVSPEILIAGIEGGHLIRTSNAGSSWDTIDFNLNEKALCTVLKKDKFTDNIICDFTYSNFFYISDDLGLNWKKIEKPQVFGQGDQVFAFEDIVMIDENKIISVVYDYKNNHNILAKSSDLGNTWDFHKESENYIQKIAFIDKDIGFMSGIYSTNMKKSIIKKTSDRGETWDYLFINNKESTGIQDLHFFDDYHYLAINSKEIFYSSDAGISWNSMSYEEPEGLLLNFIAFPEKESKGFIVSKFGYILKNNTSVDISEKSEIKKIITTYPNPLPQGQNLNIEIEMENSGNVTIDLINLLGVKVANIYEGYLSAGKRTFFKTFKENLPAGTYYLTMTVNGKDRTVKAVVLE